MSRSSRTQLVLSILVPILSTLMTFFFLEVGVRIYKKEASFENFLLKDINLFHSAYPSAYDPLLGWIPKPGARGVKNVWGTEVTISDEGIRSNGEGRANLIVQKGSILVAGDSFTFGDQVSDGESWPSYLEKELGMKVINAGTSGYGLDQAVLRAEVLSEKMKPDFLIVSFIADDIDRCTLKRRTNVQKPYFEIENGKLVLKNNPVPTPDGNSKQLGWFRGIMGYSFGFHLLMKRAFPKNWLVGEGVFMRSESTGTSGPKIACLLMDRLATLASRSRVDTIVMAQYMENSSALDLAQIQTVLTCARNAGLKVLDLKEALATLKRKDSQAYSHLFQTHLTPAGNQFVADEIARFMKKLSSLQIERKYAN